MVDEGPVVWRELTQRQAQLLGNGELRCHCRGEVVLQSVRIEGLRGAWRQAGQWDGRRLQLEAVSRQGSQGQGKLIGRVTDTVGALLAFAALERPVSMQGNRPATGA